MLWILKKNYQKIFLYEILFISTSLSKVSQFQMIIPLSREVERTCLFDLENLTEVIDEVW